MVLYRDGPGQPLRSVSTQEQIEGRKKKRLHASPRIDARVEHQTIVKSLSWALAHDILAI